jgi:processive 1,2-diacylglycerol beta-glucosyltransferase
MKILIATVTAGEGHVQAARALEEAWKSLRPQDQVKTVDVLEFVSLLQRKVYSETYLKLVKHAPELWSLLFKKTDDPALVEKTGRLRRTFARHTNRDFVKFYERTRPEVVLSTHFLPLEILSGLKVAPGGRKPFLACTVTDFEAHAFWLEEAVDLYCVAAEETKASMVARGIERGRIEVTGIPVAARFATPVNAREVRFRYGLRSDLPLMLVLGGGFGVGPMGDMLRELDKVEAALQLVVVTGRNAELRRELAGQDRKHPTDVLGYVNNMQEWMAVADLVLTKPGGLTSSEALARGRPLFIVNPIPGQETANSDFLLEHGAAVKVNRIQDIPARVRQLLGSDKLTDMKRAARELGHPQAARQVCEAVCRRISG